MPFNPDAFEQSVLAGQALGAAPSDPINSPQSRGRDDLLKDPQFLVDLRSHYRDQGIYEGDQDLIDRFFDDGNWRSLNTLSMVKGIAESAGETGDTRARSARLQSAYAAAPDFWDDGGRGIGALPSIAGAVLLDPVNLIGAGAASKFAYTAAAAGKGLGRAAIEGLLKAGVAEGALNAGIGAGQNYLTQARDVELGLRNQVDAGQVGEAALIGGAAGALGSTAFAGIGAGLKKFGGVEVPNILSAFERGQADIPITRLTGALKEAGQLPTGADLGMEGFSPSEPVGAPVPEAPVPEAAPVKSSYDQARESIQSMVDARNEALASGAEPSMSDVEIMAYRDLAAIVFDIENTEKNLIPNLTKKRDELAAKAQGVQDREELATLNREIADHQAFVDEYKTRASNPNVGPLEAAIGLANRGTRELLKPLSNEAAPAATGSQELVGEPAATEQPAQTNDQQKEQPGQAPATQAAPTVEVKTPETTVKVEAPVDGQAATEAGAPVTAPAAKVETAAPAKSFEETIAELEQLATPAEEKAPAKKPSKTQLDNEVSSGEPEPLPTPERPAAPIKSAEDIATSLAKFGMSPELSAMLLRGLNQPGESAAATAARVVTDLNEAAASKAELDSLIDELGIQSREELDSVLKGLEYAPEDASRLTKIYDSEYPAVTRLENKTGSTDLSEDYLPKLFQRPDVVRMTNDLTDEEQFYVFHAAERLANGLDGYMRPNELPLPIQQKLGLLQKTRVALEDGSGRVEQKITTLPVSKREEVLNDAIRSWVALIKQGDPGVRELVVKVNQAANKIEQTKGIRSPTNREAARGNVVTEPKGTKNAGKQVSGMTTPRGLDNNPELGKVQGALSDPENPYGSASMERLEAAFNPDYSGPLPTKFRGRSVREVAESAAEKRDRLFRAPHKGVGKWEDRKNDLLSRGATKEEIAEAKAQFDEEAKEVRGEATAAQKSIGRDNQGNPVYLTGKVGSQARSNLVAINRELRRFETQKATPALELITRMIKSGELTGDAAQRAVDDYNEWHRFNVTNIVDAFSSDDLTLRKLLLDANTWSPDRVSRVDDTAIQTAEQRLTAYEKRARFMRIERSQALAATGMHRFVGDMLKWVDAEQASIREAAQKNLDELAAQGKAAKERNDKDAVERLRKEWRRTADARDEALMELEGRSAINRFLGSESGPSLEQKIKTLDETLRTFSNVEENKTVVGKLASSLPDIMELAKKVEPPKEGASVTKAQTNFIRSFYAGLTEFAAKSKMDAASWDDAVSGLQARLVKIGSEAGIDDLDKQVMPAVNKLAAERKAILRAAATVERAPGKSGPASILDVDFNNPAKIKEALAGGAQLRAELMGLWRYHKITLTDMADYLKKLGDAENALKAEEEAAAAPRVASRTGERAKVTVEAVDLPPTQAQTERAELLSRLAEEKRTMQEKLMADEQLATNFVNDFLEAIQPQKGKRLTAVEEANARTVQKLAEQLAKKWNIPLGKLRNEVGSETIKDSGRIRDIIKDVRLGKITAEAAVTKIRNHGADVSMADKDFGAFPGAPAVPKGFVPALIPIGTGSQKPRIFAFAGHKGRETNQSLAQVLGKSPLSDFRWGAVKVIFNKEGNLSQDWMLRNVRNLDEVLASNPIETGPVARGNGPLSPTAAASNTHAVTLASGKTVTPAEGWARVLQLSSQQFPETVGEYDKMMSELRELLGLLPEIVFPHQTRRQFHDQLTKIFSGADPKTLISIQTLARRMGGETAPILREGAPSFSLADNTVSLEAPIREGDKSLGFGPTDEALDKSGNPIRDTDGTALGHGSDLENVIHEFSHWAYFNILSKEEQLQYMESMRRYYGADGRLSKSKLMADSPKSEGGAQLTTAVGDTARGMTGNHISSPAEMFANGAVRYAVSQGKLGAEPVLRKVMRWLNKVIDGFFKPTTDKELLSLYAKILPDEGKRNEALFKSKLHRDAVTPVGKQIQKRIETLESVIDMFNANVENFGAFSNDMAVIDEGFRKLGRIGHEVLSKLADEGGMESSLAPVSELLANVRRAQEDWTRKRPLFAVPSRSDMRYAVGYALANHTNKLYFAIQDLMAQAAKDFQIVEGGMMRERFNHLEFSPSDPRLDARQSRAANVFKYASNIMSEVYGALDNAMANPDDYFSKLGVAQAAQKLASYLYVLRNKNFRFLNDVIKDADGNLVYSASPLEAYTLKGDEFKNWAYGSSRAILEAMGVVKHVDGPKAKARLGDAVAEVTDDSIAELSTEHNVSVTAHLMEQAMTKSMDDLRGELGVAIQNGLKVVNAVMEKTGAILHSVSPDAAKRRQMAGYFNGGPGTSAKRRAELVAKGQSTKQVAEDLRNTFKNNGDAKSAVAATAAEGKADTREQLARTLAEAMAKLARLEQMADPSEVASLKAELAKLMSVVEPSPAAERASPATSTVSAPGLTMKSADLVDALKKANADGDERMVSRYMDEIIRRMSAERKVVTEDFDPKSIPDYFWKLSDKELAAKIRRAILAEDSTHNRAYRAVLESRDILRRSQGEAGVVTPSNPTVIKALKNEVGSIVNDDLPAVVRNTISKLTLRDPHEQTALRAVGTRLMNLARTIGSEQLGSTGGNAAFRMMGEEHFLARIGLNKSGSTSGTAFDQFRNTLRKSVRAIASNKGDHTEAVSDLLKLTIKTGAVKPHELYSGMAHLAQVGQLSYGPEMKVMDMGALSAQEFADYVNHFNRFADRVSKQIDDGTDASEIIAGRVIPMGFADMADKFADVMAKVFRKDGAAPFDDGLQDVLNSVQYRQYPDWTNNVSPVADVKNEVFVESSIDPLLHMGETLSYLLNGVTFTKDFADKYPLATVGGDLLSLPNPMLMLDRNSSIVSLIATDPNGVASLTAAAMSNRSQNAIREMTRFSNDWLATDGKPGVYYRATPFANTLSPATAPGTAIIHGSTNGNWGQGNYHGKDPGHSLEVYSAGTGKARRVAQDPQGPLARLSPYQRQEVASAMEEITSLRAMANNIFEDIVTANGAVPNGKDLLNGNVSLRTGGIMFEGNKIIQRVLDQAVADGNASYPVNGRQVLHGTVVVKMIDRLSAEIARYTDILRGHGVGGSVMPFIVRATKMADFFGPEGTGLLKIDRPELLVLYRELDNFFEGHGIRRRETTAQQIDRLVRNTTPLELADRHDAMKFLGNLTPDEVDAYMNGINPASGSPVDYGHRIYGHLRNITHDTLVTARDSGRYGNRLDSYLDKTGQDNDLFGVAEAAMSKVLKELGYDAIRGYEANNRYMTQEAVAGAMRERKRQAVLVTFDSSQSKHVNAQSFDPKSMDIYGRELVVDPDVGGKFVGTMLRNEVGSVELNVGELSRALDSATDGSAPILAKGMVDMASGVYNPEAAREIKKLPFLQLRNNARLLSETIGAKWLGNFLMPAADGTGVVHSIDVRRAEKIKPIYDVLRKLPDAGSAVGNWMRYVGTLGGSFSFGGRVKPHPDSWTTIVKALRTSKDSPRFERVMSDLSPAQKEAYTVIRGLLDDEIKWLKDNNATIGEIRDGFFPQVHHMDRIDAAEETWKTIIAKYFIREAQLERFPRTDAQAYEMAEKMLANMRDRDGIWTPPNAERKSATGDHLDYSRRLKLHDPEYADILEELEPFLDNNLMSIMTKYFDQSTRRGLMDGKFGENMHGFFDYMAVAQDGKSGAVKLMTSDKIAYRRVSEIVDGDLEHATVAYDMIKGFDSEYAAEDALDNAIGILNGVNGPNGVEAATAYLAGLKPGNKAWAIRSKAIINGLVDFQGRSLKHDAITAINQTMRRMLRKPIQTGSTYYDTANKTSRFLRNFNSVTLLSYTVPASLTDLVIPLIRSGNMGAYTKAIYKAASDPIYRDMLDKVGGHIESIIQEHAPISSGDMMSRGVNAFFVGTFLNSWTKMSRKFATAVGAEALIAAQRQAQQAIETGNMRSLAYRRAKKQLEHYGLGDYAMPGSHSLELELREKGYPAERVRAALIKFANEAVFQPGVMDTPLWAQTPVGALVWQLKSFPVMMARLSGQVIADAFHVLPEGVGIPGTGIKSRHDGSIMPLIWLLTVGVGAGAGALGITDILRMRGGEDEKSAETRQRSLAKVAKEFGIEADGVPADAAIGWYLESILAMGGLGLYAQLLHDAAQQADNGTFGASRFASSLFGPSAGLFFSAFNVLSGVADGNDSANGKERQAVREVVGRIPVLGGNKAFREMVTDKLAGEKQTPGSGSNFGQSFVSSFGSQYSEQ